jgi:hypothetical protein
VEQELLTLPEHRNSSPVFSGAGVTRSLVLCVCFIDRCLSFCTFSYGHCVVCHLRFTDSDYPFGILDLRILITPLISCGHCVVCNLRFTDSDYPFGIFWPLCCLSSTIYGFWLPLWYLLAIVLSVIYDLRILTTPLVS